MTLIYLEALVTAHEDDDDYGAILSATLGIVFFGTPHRGSEGADVGKAVATIANMFLRATQATRIVGSIRGDLLTTLGSNSQVLSDLTVSFRKRLKNLGIVTVVETQIMPGLTKLVRLLRENTPPANQSLIYISA